MFLLPLLLLVIIFIIVHMFVIFSVVSVIITIRLKGQTTTVKTILLPLHPGTGSIMPWMQKLRSTESTVYGISGKSLGQSVDLSGCEDTFGPFKVFGARWSGDGLEVSTGDGWRNRHELLEFGGSQFLLGWTYQKKFAEAWGFINSDRFAGDLFVHRDSLLVWASQSPFLKGPSCFMGMSSPP